MIDSDHVLLAGLDFGSTTSGMLLARARWSKRPATGRVELDQPQVLYRSEPAFTPFESRSDAIDIERMEVLLDDWTEASSLDLGAVFAGGVIVTGLAARRQNAAALARLVGERLGGLVVATANDPGLESWLAFMGNCAELCRTHPDETILNLDIGGGTTNPAVGRAGNVTTTGCYGIGARHLEFRPGSFELRNISDLGQQVLETLDLPAARGATLEAAAVERVVEYFVRALEALVTDASVLHADPTYQPLVERTLELDRTTELSAITLSGGVGELVYRARAGAGLPERTAFGDLGVELARGVLGSEVLSKDLDRLTPANLGRATVYGLSLHNTALSGSTLFLPQPSMLPLRDLPIVARVTAGVDQQALDNAIALARTHARGACLHLLVDGTGASERRKLKAFAARLRRSLEVEESSDERPFVLMLEANAGKTIGHYVTDWGRHELPLIVIDEIPDRGAHFVNVGRLRDGVVPIACYGVG